MKSLRLLIFTLLFVVSAFASKPTAILGPGTGGANFRVPYREQVNRVLSADTTYILTGWYFIDSTYSLTIPSGTLVRGDSASGGTLIIARGAKIFATGTKFRPIIFTSNKPAGTRGPGDWGGVVILGMAPTNKPSTQQVEGGFATVPGAQTMYGGSDPNDNSGILQYVRIEFGGIAYAQDNEINGLTFGGVGAGTTIDHIQVSFANDDDFEFFGGTLQAKYLVAWCNVDDTYDTDFGFAGKLQFLYTKRDPLLFDASASGTSCGFESDNEGSSPYTASPRTSVRFSNVTIIGPESDTSQAATQNSHWSNVAMLRRAVETSIYNSVLVGYPRGIQIRDTLTQRAAIDNRLEIRNTSLQSLSANLLTLASSPSTGNIAGFNVTDWYKGDAPYSPTGNLGYVARNPIDVGFSSEAWNLDWTNNPVPGSSSEPATAGTSYQGRLAGDTWFDSVSYRGAFDPSKPRDQQWDWGWTNYDPQNYDPEAPVTGMTYQVEDGWNMVSLPIKGSISKATAFPSASSDAFSYSAGYVSQSNLSNGNGYWVKFNGSQSFSTIVGVTNLIDTFQLSSRWNMIGALSAPVAASSLTTNPPGNISSSYFGYDGSYSVVDTLRPGKGYWVKVTDAGQLFLNVSNSALKSTPSFESAIETMNQIVISDSKNRTQNLYYSPVQNEKVSLSNYELPPVPPASGFDARFITQRYVGFGSEYTVQIQGSYPIKVKFSGKSIASNYIVEEIQDGKIVASHNVNGSSNVVINDSKTTTLVIKVNGQDVVPATYSLDQNYPNPFNPSTMISYALPVSGNVKLSVYNVLGQEVATLVNGMQEAGFKTISFDAANLPTGMYIYKLSSGTFSMVKKMMFTK